MVENESSVIGEAGGGECEVCTHPGTNHRRLTLDGLFICQDCPGSYQCHKLIKWEVTISVVRGEIIYDPERTKIRDGENSEDTSGATPEEALRGGGEDSEGKTPAPENGRPDGENREQVAAGKACGQVWTLDDLQRMLPWTIKYSRDFRANPQEHKDFTHAHIHAMKALGKIAAIIDDYDHRRSSEESHRLPDYLADLVICALRMANTFPAPDPIPLGLAVVQRIESKNGTTLQELAKQDKS